VIFGSFHLGKEHERKDSRAKQKGQTTAKKISSGGDTKAATRSTPYRTLLSFWLLFLGNIAA